MFYINKNQKGVVLYLTIMVLSVLTASLLALISLAVSQIKIIWTAADSINAFYAADSGIEEVLFHIYKQGFDPAGHKGECPYSGRVGQASYQVCVSQTSGSSINSVGSYKNTKRAIEINF